MANTPFEGIARKLVLPLIVLTAIGWLVVVVGFGIGSTGDEDQPRDEPEQYPYWIVCLSGPFTFAAAVIHAALWKPWSPLAAWGCCTTFLNVLFLTGLGMILYLTGNFIRAANEENEDLPDELEIDIPNYIRIEFAGAFLATFFGTPVMILWNFYDGFWVKAE